MSNSLSNLFTNSRRSSALQEMQDSEKMFICFTAVMVAGEMWLFLLYSRARFTQQGLDCPTFAVRYPEERTTGI